MKSNSLYRAVVGALVVLAATGALATGTHAGGHDGTEAIGKPGNAAKATRTVKIDMIDAMRFVPASVYVRRNETVRFLITNSGHLKHELVLGTDKALKDHHEVMKKNPEMEHDDPNMVSLGPGKSGEVIWHFTKAGKVDFACLQPGHYDAGMRGTVNVSKTAGQADRK